VAAGAAGEDVRRFVNLRACRESGPRRCSAFSWATVMNTPWRPFAEWCSESVALLASRSANQWERGRRS